MGTRAASQIAIDKFINRLRDLGHQVEPDRVIARDNIYRVDETAYLLIRTSRYHDAKHTYFFGLTHHVFENFSQLPNAFIAFLFSDTLDVVLLPAQWLWKQHKRLSTNESQYKLLINKQLQMRLFNDKESAIDLNIFRNRYELLDSEQPIADPKAETKGISTQHADLQGMLIEIGNMRGYKTYSPNKSPRFKGKSLAQITTVKEFPEFPGLNNNILRQIDVVWLDRVFPVHAFEVELTTGIWTGLVRLAELRRLKTELHVITESDEKAFRRRVSGDIFTEILAQCHHASASEIQELYELELRRNSIDRNLYLR